MTYQMIFALLAMIIAASSLFIPNKYINTSSCKSNWTVILTILAGASFFTYQNGLGAFFATILISGIFINYAFPFLLNVLRTFTWKSDP